MRTFVLSLAAVAAVAFTGVASVHATGITGPVVAAASAADASPAPSPMPSPTSYIHIKDFAFVPATVTVHPGQTVRFIQDDDSAHTVTASDKSFDSGNLNKKETWSHTFDTAGTYAYVCAYHPSMRGTIVVK